jgi:PAS domain S-box-containing protein
VQNIDALKQAELALGASEQQFSAIVNQATAGISQTDLSGKYQLANKRFCQITGYDEAELLAIRMQDITHPDDLPGNVAQFEELARGGLDFTIEKRYLRKDGSIAWVNNCVTGLRDASGNLQSIICVTVDISQRKEAELALAEVQAESSRQRRLYEAILNNTPDLAYIFGLDHRFAYANERLLQMWGRSWNEAIGKTCLELGYEPWHAAMHDREIDQVAATKQPLRGEVPFTGAFGRRIYDYILVPVIGPNGEVEAVAGTTRDVTERKTAEQALEQADKRKDEFLATLAHELRNPLAPIRSSIHILSMSTRGDAAAEQVCEIMERQVTQMVRLVDDLLEISRITRGSIELRCEETTLAEIVRTAIDTSQPAITAGGHQLSVTLPPEKITLYGDAVRLSQVISNLLNNAAKYTDRGGQIWISAQHGQGEVVVRVRDNGIGIPVEMIPLVFDMFVQVDRTASRAQGGLGIGLTLVKRLVEMHGGHVAVDSPGPNLGSTFTVRLPTSAEKTAPAAAHLSANVPQTPRRRVLIVDDNRDAATSLGMLLTAMGSEVQIANDGPTALAIMERYQPEVVLLDLGMPGMDGFQVAEQIRASERSSNVKICALTGWGQVADRERTQAAGFDDHLIKPVGMEQIQQILNCSPRSDGSGWPVQSRS